MNNFKQIGRICKGSLKVQENCVNFSIVYNSVRKNVDSTYLSCATFNKRLIDVFKNHVKEGQVIDIEGNLESWSEDNNGQTFYNTVCYVQDVNIMAFQFTNNKAQEVKEEEAIEI